MHALEVSEVSSDGSIVSHILGAPPAVHPQACDSISPGRPLSSPAPAYHSPEPLPRFPSWDRSWVGGGVTLHGDHAHGWTTRPPRSEVGERWVPETPSLPPFSDDHDPYGLPDTSWHPAPLYPTRSEAGFSEPRSTLSDRERALRIRALDKAYALPVADEDDEAIARRAARRAATIRTWLAATQILLALAASLGTVGAAFLAKPASKPPPQGAAPTYALYALSFISFIAYLYCDLIVPCCASDRKETAYDGLVIPLLGAGDSNSGGGGCCGGRNKRKNRQGAGQSPVINLIVPHLDALGRAAEPRSPPARSGRTSAPPSRRSGPATLASARKTGADDWDEASSADEDEAEAERDAIEKRARPGRALQPRPLSSGARRRIKRRIVLDLLAIVLWAAVAVWAIGRSKCPPGSSNGWCDAYNGALAAGVLLACTACVTLVLAIIRLRKAAKIEAADLRARARLGV